MDFRKKSKIIDKRMMINNISFIEEFEKSSKNFEGKKDSVLAAVDLCITFIPEDRGD